MSVSLWLNFLILRVLRVSAVKFPNWTGRLVCLRGFGLDEGIVDFFHLVAELAGVQLVILAAQPEQLGVGANLVDPSILDYRDAVGALDGRKAMGDDEAGAALH